MKNANKPVFPVTPDDMGSVVAFGMTKREYVAALVLAQLSADEGLGIASAADAAVAFADALFKRLDGE